ncbi:putative aminoacyltransferase, E1 ubiquitin-activating enzyme [Heracleum sosnowskyi]|uniref:Aminoacyltransferase, E1 ubiquitin-activating enzyme n=1 Tax=Heracleum sosnowskyi TaxID=360622 RepID=A0AAD8H1I0_9APIA|nr:putative aminoacyltransferase, E1 ubiquitin-activating enzyme [Heracleum sosnowskyi]
MEISLQNPNGVSKKFPQFDTGTDASDHFYFKSNNTRITSTNTPFYKAIMKEWKILDKNLPHNSIYVRIYENRIDLLRAVIVGASGTPYHDGLFFFDFFFPAEYPNKPPLVRYKSFGFRSNPSLINPNFTGTGKVCLSILNTTWSGPSWQPNVSTVLQVLVSIQGLVLNEDPSIFMTITYDYYWSKKYSDNVFALSCQTMIQLLRRPPLNFEEFVVEHFRDRGRCILSACKAYMNGYVRVGKYQDCESLVCDRKVKVSKTFLSLMTQKYSILFNLFVKNDPSLNDFRVQLNELMEKTETEYVEKAKLKEKKLMSRFSGIVKKLFVLNKCVKGNTD